MYFKNLQSVCSLRPGNPGLGSGLSGDSGHVPTDPCACVQAREHHVVPTICVPTPTLAIADALRLFQNVPELELDQIFCVWLFPLSVI